MTLICIALMIVMAALALLICQHLLLLGLVVFFNRRFQPLVWLFGRSQPAIRVTLHLSALIIFAIGMPLGFLFGSNLLLARCAGLVAVISSGAEWTFIGNWGPVARLLRAQERQHLEHVGGD